MQPGASHSDGFMSASHFTMETSKKRYLSTMVLPSVRSSQTQCRFSSIHSEISLSEYTGIHPLYTVEIFTLCTVDLYGLLHNFLDEGNLSEQHFCVHRFGLQFFSPFFLSFLLFSVQCNFSALHTWGINAVNALEFSVHHEFLPLYASTLPQRSSFLSVPWICLLYT